MLNDCLELLAVAEHVCIVQTLCTVEFSFGSDDNVARSGEGEEPKESFVSGGAAKKGKGFLLVDGPHVAFAA